MALMAYPNVNIVASFVYRCLREAVPPHSLERELITCNEHHLYHTGSGLQEHRIIVYTATGQKAKPKVHLSTESTEIV
jgi:hypothetical protein